MPIRTRLRKHIGLTELSALRLLMEDVERRGVFGLQTWRESGGLQ
jgi:hypothetical protein